ncbi:hypothetical protein [Photobacterium sanguinicancri]|uniref:Uncharacterized protein n=1 Tax=Photobacterium sanguinicancri TaxID=875932 RepID=A0AAW7YBC3_9GAMM|nr:hypothetical protein [Photobacterium sanguinicancri]KXI24218.1 hypothetical protein AS132_02510 [Photobacterium sanguinicancri]MDO6497581.1 hypothetical protein [Photobacterium sanguinicancri]MDO6544307.1 hypothetical protein [Photobacterium sanguinicancri]OZS44828.1 hypothetical protein ASV53_06000 [Photobacterium sanguinicancri]
MNEWSKGLVLFSALLSPLAMADWLLDVNFELTGADSKQTVNTSLSLLPGEETVFFDTDDQGNTRRELVGSAELLEVSAEELKIAFKVQERLDDGGWRTIIAPVLSTGLNTPASFESIDNDANQQVKLQIEVTSV